MRQIKMILVLKDSSIVCQSATYDLFRQIGSHILLPYLFSSSLIKYSSEDSKTYCY